MKSSFLSEQWRCPRNLICYNKFVQKILNLSHYNFHLFFLNNYSIIPALLNKYIYIYIYIFEESVQEIKSLVWILSIILYFF